MTANSITRMGLAAATFVTLVALLWSPDSSGLLPVIPTDEYFHELGL